jgi:hypothetical protein
MYDFFSAHIELKYFWKNILQIEASTCNFLTSHIVLKHMNSALKYVHNLIIDKKSFENLAKYKWVLPQVGGWSTGLATLSL